jgi:peptidoglycan/LPS O-acetylase OafA/YrhL
LNKSRRLLELDALRGIAAIGVVLFHYLVAFASIYEHPNEILPSFRYFRYGSHGVELFFIISGFVIFMSLERTKNSSDFIFGRFSRLYPTYWTAVILSFTVVTIARLPNLHIDLKDALVNLTMLQEFLNVRHIDGNYWTLEIELSFYIIMLFLHVTKFLRRINLVAVLWLLLICTNFLLETLNISLFEPRLKTFLILDRAHFFIIGMLLYKIFSSQKDVAFKYFIICICLLFSLLKGGGESLLFASLFVATFVAFIKGNLMFINQKPLLFLGTISYSLYLTHLHLGMVTIKTLEKLGVNINISIAAALCLAILVATAITFFIEKPAIRFLKSRYRRFNARTL